MRICIKREMFILHIEKEDIERDVYIYIYIIYNPNPEHHMIYFIGWSNSIN